MRKHLLVGATILLSTSLFAWSPCRGADGENHFLWQVSSKTATAFLMGSVHLARPEIYPLPQVIEDSFDKASILAVEADPEQAGDPAIQQQMLQAARYPAGETLRQHLSPKGYEEAARELKKSGLDIEQFNGIKPWFLAMTLELLELAKLGYDPALGIDRHFSDKARGKKQIVELESFDYQISLMSGFSEREQELFLLYGIKENALLGEYIEKLMRAWRTGDGKTMESIMTKTVTDYPDAAPIFHKLINKRNGEMTEKIVKMLHSGKSAFIVVGAAHLVGREGIVELLKKKGFAVRQL